MNDEYGRLKALLEDAGLDFSETSITNAEILSYSQGLGIIRSFFESIYNCIFINLDSLSDFTRYLDMINEKADGLTQDETRQMITRRLSYTFGDYTKSGFYESFEKTGGEAIAIKDSTVTITITNLQSLEKTGKFIKGYAFVLTHCKSDGDGMTFDNWDTFNKNFLYCDGLELPFSIIDSLRSDIIEQHE